MRNSLRLSTKFEDRFFNIIHLSTTLKEGGVGTRSLIFLSEKLLYFFLGLCDYLD